MSVSTDLPGAPIRAPRGNGLSCRGWHQEAALRMQMNNLDPEVAEHPEAVSAARRHHLDQPILEP